MFKLKVSDLFEYRQQGGARGFRGKVTKDDERELAELSALKKSYRLGELTIRPTLHSSAQAYQRRPDMSVEDWRDFHLQVVKKIRDDQMPGGEYIFFSRSMNQAYVVSYNERKKLIKIITVLPEGRSRPKPGTKKVLMESGILQYVEID